LSTGPLNLSGNYGYTMWASNKAQELADDGKLSTADLKNIAATVGNKDGQISAKELEEAGFNAADAKAIFEQLKKTGWKEISVSFDPSMLQKLAKQTTQAANTAVQTTKAFVATTGAVVNQAAQKAVNTVKTAVVATGKVIEQTATKIATTAKTVAVATGKVVANAAAKTVETAKTVAANTKTFVKATGTGIAHGASHLAHAVTDFAKEHPVITGAIVVGAAALITVASGGVAGPVAAGMASSVLSGIGTAGLVGGGAITAIKTGQSVYFAAKGDYQKAGEKFGEGLFEAGATFVPGAAIKGLAKVAHGAHAAHGVAEGAHAVAEGAKHVGKASTVAKAAHVTEKVGHVSHQMFEAPEIVSAKGSELLHMMEDAMALASKI
jgi:hypothetical protein